MKKKRRCKCQYCKELFVPDVRNKNRQKSCKKPECRITSKKSSQGKWLNKPKNRDYFRSPENVVRVQQWRKKNPGYWKRSKKNNIPLQDPLTAQQPKKQSDMSYLNTEPLQDSFSLSPAVFIGLISNLTNCTLQEDIALNVSNLKKLGEDILNINHQLSGGKKNGDTYRQQRASPESPKII